MPDQKFTSSLRKVFWGPKGIRAGWRFLIFVGLCEALGHAIEAGFERVPLTARILSEHVRGIMTVPFATVIEIPISAFFLSALIMSKFERRPFGRYGLPLAGAFGKLFWQGVVWGFMMASVAMAAIYALGGFSFGTFALSGFAAVQYGVLWAFACLLIGLGEEFQYRGYAQFTLSSGIGFWLSALLMSAFFGANHLGNRGENWVGAIDCVVVGRFWVLHIAPYGQLVVRGRNAHGMEFCRTVCLFRTGQRIARDWDSAELRLSWPSLAHGWHCRP